MSIETLTPKYPLSDELIEELKRRFTYHAPKHDQLGRYELIRDTAGGLALIICSNAPDCRERALALTHLETAVMHANAAIARRE